VVSSVGGTGGVSLAGGTGGAVELVVDVEVLVLLLVLDDGGGGGGGDVSTVVDVVVVASVVVVVASVVEVVVPSVVEVVQIVVEVIDAGGAVLDVVDGGGTQRGGCAVVDVVDRGGPHGGSFTGRVVDVVLDGAHGGSAVVVVEQLGGAVVDECGGRPTGQVMTFTVAPPAWLSDPAVPDQERRYESVTGPWKAAGTVVTSCAVESPVLGRTVPAPVVGNAGLVTT
jgi:hypothetical protein